MKARGMALDDTSGPVGGNPYQFIPEPQNAEEHEQNARCWQWERMTAEAQLSQLQASTAHAQEAESLAAKANMARMVEQQMTEKARKEKARERVHSMQHRQHKMDMLTAKGTA